MKRQPRILAGTALGLLMASAPLGASPLQGGTFGLLQTTSAVPFILAQADCQDGETAEACASRQAEPEAKPRKKTQEQEQQAEPAAPAEQAAPAAEPEQKPRRKKDRQEQQAEPAAPAEEPARKSDSSPAQAEQAPAQDEKPADQAAEPKSKKEKLRGLVKKNKGTAEETAEPKQAEQPRAEQPRAEQPKAEEAKPAEQAAPTEEPAPNAASETPKVDQGEKPAEQAAEPKTRKEKLREFLNKKKGGDGQTRGEPRQAEKPKPAEDGKPAEQAAPETPEAAPEQKAGEPVPAGKEAEGGGQQATQPELPADTAPQTLPKGEAEAKPLPENAAPLPDSAKKGGDGKAEGQAEPQQAEQPAEEAQPPTAEAIPQSDSAAQTAIEKIGKIESVEAVEGKRLDPDQWRKERRKRRDERRDRNKGDVLKEVGDRIVVKFGDNIYVDNRDTNVRLERNSRDSYVEELPRGFTRYTIVKENGARVVTIRNADGDIVRRSRIMPDDREVVLYYVPETYYDRLEGGYADAGADLPPLRLTIPADEYILDAETAEPDDYYTYLDAPPVEPVERIYSVDEVVHSARIRDKVRRIDLDTITFDTGSADIGEEQATKLEALGNAMAKILKQNPAETFLIEGHTDAVGSDESNLVLSDQRAESVAEALTSVFEIPAENLTTQGYGEQYLKVKTEGDNRENRRVAVRRITPLVSPVASAN